MKRLSRCAMVVTTAAVIAAAGPITAPITSRAAVSGATTLAVRGTDDALWINAGGGWQSLGGRLLSAPAWATTAGGTTAYVVTGSDHALWVRSATSAWQHLANGQEYCLDTPAVAVSGTTFTAACAGNDHGLWYAQATTGGSALPQAGGWTSLGGQLITGPAVATVQGQTTFAVVGTDRSVFLRTAGTPYTSTTWSCLGHPALADDGPQAYFACHGLDDAAWYAQNGGAGWGAALSAGGRLVGGAALVANPGGGGADLYVEGVDHQVYGAHIARNGAANGYTLTGGVVDQGGVGGQDTFIAPVTTSSFPAGDAFNNPACQVPADTLPVHGKVIVLSIACQVMTAYQDGRAMFSSLTTTGRPARPTPRGHFSVVKKNHPWQMISGDPRSSPYWYPPSWVQYVIWFTFQGHGIHDSSWEPNSEMGPGSEFNQTIASHGCVHINSGVVAGLYNWADMGIPVLVF